MEHRRSIDIIKCWLLNNEMESLNSRGSLFMERLVEG